MNNAIKIFEHEKFGKVRTVMINGEAWFAGIDVAKALGYKNISRDIRRHVYPEDFQNYRRPIRTALQSSRNCPFTM